MSGTSWVGNHVKKLVAGAAALLTVTGYALFHEGDAPDTPDAGKLGLYAKTDGRFYIKDDTGAERDVADGGDAATLDGIQRTQFLRTDEAATAAGPLTLTNALNLGAHAVFTEIAAPAVSSTGYARLYADSTSHTLKLSTNGGAYSDVGAVTYKNTADSTAITGATETDTIFDTYHTIPANTLRVGSIIRVRAIGQHTATTGTETSTEALKLGTVTIASGGANNPADNDIFAFDYEITVRTIGASGTISAQGWRMQGAMNTQTARPNFLAGTTVDTTGALTVGVWIDRQASATDSDSAVLRTISVQVIY